MLKDCLANEYDAIVLPGGMPGAKLFHECTPLVDLLKKQNAAGKIVAAICASPAVVLAQNGLLDGKKALCYPHGFNIFYIF